jgi:hypothetical protein
MDVSLLHPQIAATKSHIFASPMDSTSMGEGSQEAMKEGGYGAALPHDAVNREGAPRTAASAGATLRLLLPPSSSLPPSPSPTPPCIKWFILPHTSVTSYVNMVFDGISYNPMIYVMFV